MVADPTLWQVHCLRICPRRMMTTRTVTMDLLIRMMTMILGMVAAHLLRLGHWIRWAALSWSLRIVHQWMVLTFLPTQGGGRVAGVSGGRTSWGLPALCIQGVQERKWRLHPRRACEWFCLVPDCPGTRGPRKRSNLDCPVHWRHFPQALDYTYIRHDFMIYHIICYIIYDVVYIYNMISWYTISLNISYMM